MRGDLKTRIMDLGKRFNKRHFTKLMGDFNLTDYHVIAAIHEYGENAKNTKGAISDLKKSPMIANMGVTALSRSLKDLEYRDLIKRHKDDVDKRKTFVELSKAGEDLYLEKQEIFKSFWERVFNRFGEEHTEKLIKQLNALAEIVDDEMLKFNETKS